MISSFTGMLLKVNGPFDRDFISLIDNKKSDLSKMKALADDKLNVAQIKKFVSQMI